MMSKAHQQKRDQQKLNVLKHSLKIIRAFAVPSLHPKSFENFEEIEKELIERYSGK